MRNEFTVQGIYHLVKIPRGRVTGYGLERRDEFGLALGVEEKMSGGAEISRKS